KLKAFIHILDDLHRFQDEIGRSFRIADNGAKLIGNGIQLLAVSGRTKRGDLPTGLMNDLGEFLQFLTKQGEFRNGLEFCSLGCPRLSGVLITPELRLDPGESVYDLAILR